MSIARNRNIHPLKGLYDGMKSRCNNKSSISYYNYGARGIKVCDRWSGEGGFRNFLEDMGDRPSPGHSIDRIDTDGDYEPNNVQWSTRHYQNTHKRTNNKCPGVHYDKWGHNWRSQMKIKGIFVLNKRYELYEDAVKARKQAELTFL